MKNPIILMSAITGKPTEAQIFEYLKSLTSGGIFQIMLYPRSGCELEYLSDEWFLTIENYIKFAQTLGMNIWLYDDFNWPSGDAAGRVTAIPEYRLKSICIKGENLGKISCYSTHNSSIFGEKFFPDLLNEKAVDYFIKCTHEKYYKKFGAYFGNVITGLFTDEPAIGYCATEESIPYYQGIEKDYHTLCGRDFFADIKDDISFFCKTCFSLVGDKFNTCFIRKIRSWCETHNLIMTGHLLGDNDPVSSTTQNGNFLKCLSSFMVPGVDELHTDLSSDSVLPLYGATEYARGENGAMAELFGLGPCNLSYNTKRCAIFLAACFKINHYFMGCSHLDMRGNMKITDYFNNISADQPDFAGMKLLSLEAEKAAAYAKKDFIPDVYIKYPAEIVAKNYTNNIKYEPFLKLINALSSRQIQWKYTLSDKNEQNIPVIDFDNSLNGTLNDIAYPEAYELCDLLSPHITVTNLDGSLPEGIFVRRFSEGSFIVLNLFGKADDYIIDGKKVFLYKQDVYISDSEECCYQNSPKEKIDAKLKLTFSTENMTRPIFSSESPNAEIFCEQDTLITFAVRNGATAFLDGEKIITSDKNNDKLSQGIKSLYTTSETLSLAKGFHTLTSGKDFKYLPSVFIVGDFKATDISHNINRTVVQKRKSSFKSGECFSDYGGVKFCLALTVPAGAKAIELVGANLYTRMFIGETLVDEKICYPYIFKIDSGFSGKKIKLTFEQFSSIAPIFGNLEFYTKVIPNAQWDGAPLPHETRFGWEEINWIF